MRRFQHPLTLVVILLLSNVLHDLPQALADAASSPPSELSAPLPPGVSCIHLPPNSAGTLVVGPDDSLYLGGSYPCQVQALTPNGKERWIARGLNKVLGFGPDGVVYAQHPDRKLVALGPDGLRRWEHPMDMSTGDTSEVAIAADGTVYLQDHGKLEALESTGKVKWQSDHPAGTSLGLVANPLGGFYRVTILPSTLESLDGNGKLRWTFVPVFSTYQDELHLPVVASDGTAYASSWAKIFVIGPDGVVKWKFPFFGPGTPLRAPDGTVPLFVGEHICAVSPDGLIRWTNPSKYAKVGIGNRGMIYLVDDTGQPVALNPDGSLAWKARLPGAGGSPIMSPDGTVFLEGHYFLEGRDNGIMYIIH